MTGVMGRKRLITAVFHPVSLAACKRNGVEPQREHAKGAFRFAIWTPPNGQGKNGVTMVKNRLRDLREDKDLNQRI